MDAARARLQVLHAACQLRDNSGAWVLAYKRAREAMGSFGRCILTVEEWRDSRSEREKCDEAGISR